MKDFRKTEFVVFDVETTGLSPQGGDRIVEIAALKIKNLEPVARFHSLVDPQREISPGAFEVNGITPWMLNGKPKAGEILPDFLEFIGGFPLVGHNIAFDLSFLIYELSLLGLKPREDIVSIDTIPIARALLPGLRRYPLWFVARSLGITQEQEHRAAADVELTFKVLCALVKIAEQHKFEEEKASCGPKNIELEIRTRETDRKIAEIKDAMARGLSLNIQYYSPATLATTVRKVTPRQLSVENGQPTLIGFCHLRGEERGFRIDRIMQIEKICP